MSQIWYAAYSSEFVETAREIFKKLGKDVYVTVWNPSLMPEMVKSGIRVILGRGATAKRIRAAGSLPVVEIPIPFEDMVQTLISASRYGKNIGVIGYNNLLSGLELLNPILNVNIRQIFAVDSEDTFRQIQKLKAEGVDVIVGGLIQTQYAAELEIPSARLELSEKALAYACAQAEELLGSDMASARKAEEFKAILNTTKEKYIAVDRQGNIAWMNRKAKEYLPSPDSHVYETPLTEVFPEFEQILSVLDTGTEVLQETASIGGTDILYDMIPLTFMGNEVLGAVIAFNDSRTITRGEQKIRDRETKGFQAVYSFRDICGTSPEIHKCIRFAKRYAREELTVLLLGESGSGKELFAQSIHNASSRKNGPFVAVNCAALPEGILESELFGYDEGAFTGAKRNGKRGLFELAHNGTIFLDEIAEMPMALQSRLLRVLQEKRVMRLGGDRVFPVNVRIIAATNQNLTTLIREKKFREDLFYRLNVLTLRIPPLRERREDILDLAEVFLRESCENCTLSPEAARAISAYSWPGNARQLRYFMEKLRILSDSEVIAGSTVTYVIKNFEPSEAELTGWPPDRILETGPDPRQEGKEPAVEDPQKEDLRKTDLRKEDSPKEDFGPLTEETIMRALKQAEGNKTKAAGILGIHRSTLWRRMKQLGMTEI